METKNYLCEFLKNDKKQLNLCYLGFIIAKSINDIIIVLFLLIFSLIFLSKE